MFEIDREVYETIKIASSDLFEKIENMPNEIEMNAKVYKINKII